jgi:dihydroneopterin aldolase/2-amino-4-hydroxy-6-hydroxymethyldihydropteridine diphosphokinase
MTTSDRIVLRGVRARGRHGVLPAERELGQEFVVDVVLELDLGPAAATDDLHRTVHYGLLAEAVAARVAGEPYELIESLAGAIAADCLTDPLVAAAEVTVHKPAAPISVPFADVAVTVSRARRVPAVVALGANLGDRRAALQGAVYALAAMPRTRVVAVAPVFETAALTLPGSGPQPDYLNTVVLLETALPAADLLAAGHAVEAAFGRERVERWGARTLDVDLVVHADTRSDDPTLTLPHPGAAERAFVLAPWAAVDPAARLGGTPVVALLAELPAGERAGVRRRDDLALVVPSARVAA